MQIFELHDLPIRECYVLSLSLLAFPTLKIEVQRPE